jgi:hypothetical protein
MSTPQEQAAELRFTPTEQAALDLLSDGNPHHRDQFLPLIPHGQGDHTNVKTLIQLLRTKLRRKGHDIVLITLNRQKHYRHVILLPPESYLE